MDRIKAFAIKYKLPIIIIAAAVTATVVLALIFSRFNKNNESENRETETNSETQTESTTELMTVETEPETTEQEDVKLSYSNPLTGEMTANDYSNVRPVAVMLNTIKEALPQSGNSKADILIEMAEEGGITRIMGIYQDITGVGNIGTVRSTREYYLAWTRAFDAIMVHAGGDSWVLDEIKNSGEVTVNSLSNAGGTFWRDQERLKSVSIEHTLYTSSNNLQNWLSASGMSMAHTKQNYTVFNFTDELDENLMTAAADSVKVTFSGYKSTTFNYNKESGCYDVYFWNNEPYMDESAKTQVSVTNIIVLPVPNWTDVDAWGKTRQKYNLSGGVGYYISGGKYTQINWTKGDYNKQNEYGNPLILTNVNGEKLELAVGKTYICVVSNAFGVSITGE